MTTLRFSKMHGLGNDFMVLDLITQSSPALSSALIRQWSNRHTGIGFDQLLLVETTRIPGIDFKYRIFNADGGEVEQCGNGARCFAHFVALKKLSIKTLIKVETCSGVIELQLLDNQQVIVDMGIPDFNPSAIPLNITDQADVYDIPLHKGLAQVGSVSVGNPHAVVMVDDTNTAPVLTMGAEIESHPLFPQRVNVGFMQILSRTHAKLRVFERGVGETQACGTGACAAMVIARQRNLLDEHAQLELTGGVLSITWAGSGSSIKMQGPSSHVYEGNIQL